MSNNMNSADYSSNATASHSYQPSVRRGPVHIFNLIFEFILFVIIKLMHGCVIFATFISGRFVEPVTLYGVALYGLIARVSSDLLHITMCGCHYISVSLSRIKANRITSALLITALTVIVISSSFYSLGLEVIINGDSIGYVDSRADFKESCEFVEHRASEILERPYIINHDVCFNLKITPREKLLSSEDLKSMFFSEVTEMSQLYVLTVDGEAVGASQNKESLQGILDTLLGANQQGNVKAEFMREVSITKKYADASNLCSHEEIMNKLTSTIHDERYYTIAPGDTLDKIARDNGITKADLIALNPGLNANRLTAGKNLLTSRKLAFLPVKKIVRVESCEQIPFETKTENSSNLYKGRTSVKVAGVRGQAKVVRDIEYLDNDEINRNTVSYTVVKQPVTQVTLVGTKTPPRTVATGRFRRPTGGYVSSNYGYRGREFHSGVDFALKLGSKVVAADGGTVSFSGWKGNFGKLVIINHGNGMQTYYAHNSTLLVKAGQKVAKGEQIAKVGSTGRSSGPHCHFEIRVNGRHVNPWRYLK